MLENICCPASLSHSKNVTYLLNTVQQQTPQKRHNNGARPSWRRSGIRTCARYSVQTSIPSTSPYAPSWRVMWTQLQTPEPPPRGRSSRRYGPTTVRTPYGALAYQRWSVWRLWSRSKVAMFSPGGLACGCTCLGVYLPKRFPICSKLFQSFENMTGKSLCVTMWFGSSVDRLYFSWLQHGLRQQQNIRFS